MADILTQEMTKVRTHYDPILHKPAKPVELFDAELSEKIAEMFPIMEGSNGIGLAANQVGWDARVVVAGYKSKDKDDLEDIPKTILINPQIIFTGKKETVLDEGCLSLPGFELPVTRPETVSIQARDEQGKAIKLEAKGTYAHILQHEMDHLNGVLFPSRSKDWQNLKYYRHMKIVFLGSDEFSEQILAELVKNLNVMAVITESDKPAGRGRELTENAIKKFATSAEISIFQPEDTQELTEIISQLQPDLLILASYGKILPETALTAPPFGAVNVHPSLLPKYRGATPIQTAIRNGDSTTGVTIMKMARTVDAGEIISQKEVAIEPVDTALTLRANLADVGAKLLLKELPGYLCARTKLQNQNEDEVVLTKKLSREDGLIDWQKPVEILEREIRAFVPWPGSYTYLGDERLIIRSARLLEGKLQPLEVQLAGKKPMKWSDFTKGYHNQLTKESWWSKIS